MTEEVKKILNQRKVRLLFYLIVLAVGLLVGGGLEKLRSDREIKSLKEEIAVLQKSLEMFYPPLPEEIRSISGEIKRIEENFLEVETIMRVSRFPLPEGKEMEKQIKKVRVEEDTKIVKIEWEMAVPPEMPTPKETVLKLEDLKVGDRVMIASEENIKDKKEFKAIRIGVVTMP